MATPIIRREIVYAKTQAAIGTAVAVAAADAVRCYETSFAYEGLKSIERMTAGGTMGRVGNVYGGTHGKIGLSFEMCGLGEDMPAEHAAFLQAAGMVEAIDSTAHTTKYSLTSQETMPLSMTFNQDGWQRRLQDCRPMAFSISGTTGETLRATMELAGLLTQGNDTAQSGPAPEYSSRIPIVCQGAVVTITKGGAAAITTPIEAFNMDFQLATVTPPDMAATHGFARPVITDRAPTITLSPEFDRMSDFLTDMQGNVPYSIEILYAATTAEQNRLRIKAPQCFITSIEDGDRSGIRTRELGFQCAKTGAGDNEVEFIFD